MSRKLWTLVTLFVVAAFVLSACAQPAPAPAPVPTIVPVPPTPVPVVPVGPIVEPQRVKLDSTPRVAVESAFGAELTKLLAATQIEKTYVVNGRRFTLGKLAGNNVVLFLSGVSMVNAGMTTQQVLDYFNVTHLVFSGIAGGVNPNLNIGDVVVPSQWAQYQETTFVREKSDGTFSGKSDLPNFGMAFPSTGVSVVQKDSEGDKATTIRWFPVDATMLKVAQAVAAKAPLGKCGKDKDGKSVCLSQQPQVKVGGNGVAGPTFVDNATFRQYAWDVFRADSLDMESSAVAHVAYVNKIPFVVFRSLSDLAGGGPGENEIGTFFTIAADNSANVLLAFLTSWSTEANKAAAPVTVKPPVPATTAAQTGLQIPDVEKGKFNVAYVLIGPHDDGGWSQAHHEGFQYVEKNMSGVHTAYIENVPEGADSEQVFRSLSRKGFSLIVGTSFGYMDPMETVAGEFPDITYVHVSGYKSNTKNYGNLFGAMEDMKYLAGMLAGARAKKDGNPKLGYMATFPIPEELRLGNAFMLGAKKTCPGCTMDVRWINTWHDPVAEKDAAASLFDAGAQVVLTGADTPAVADVAQAKLKWGITYDYIGSCKVERCLTTIYWNWGPVYANIVKQIIAKTYKPGWEYFDADSGSLGIWGFMEGQSLTTGMKDLPPETIQMVKDTLAKMLAGKFTRFDVFAGPIKDNTGKIIVPAGEKMVQADLDQFPPGAPGLACKYCMKWWAEGIKGELPK